MTKNNRLGAAPVIILALLSLFFCGLPACREQTDNIMIRRLIGSIGNDVEGRDTEALLAKLTDDYRDLEGRDKNRTKDLLTEYFGRTRGVVMNILGTRVDMLDASRAAIRTEVAFSSGAARVLRKLLRISTESYRFSLSLIKDEGGWKIQHAAWEEINPDELSPESQSLFQKLFPDF